LLPIFKAINLKGNIKMKNIIEYQNKKDLIKQIEQRNLTPLSMNATINDFKIYLQSKGIETKIKGAK
jgi:hypothetical protein